MALHAGGLPGYASSHGCVHLPSEFARRLFEISPMGMTVVVAKDVESPLAMRHPTFLAPVDPQGQVAALPRLADDQPFRGEPTRAPDGPLSMVLSMREQRLVAMRNGVEIGRSRVSVTKAVAAAVTTLYVAHRDPARQALAWRAVALGGSQTNTIHAMTEGFELPHDFSRQLASLLDDETTLVVTDAEILPHTTGVPVTVLTSHPLASR